MIDNPHGYKSSKYYTWKICPYSTKYKELFYDLGFRGSSRNSELLVPTWVPFITTEHTTTDGGMKYKNCGHPGWVCEDPNCYYFLTFGEKYFEC